MLKRQWSTRAISLLAVPCAAMPALVLAQAEAPAPTAALEEIIVTAQKRAENAQDVPIAITALSAAALEEKGVTNVTQVSDFTPNVQIDRASPFAGSSTIVSAFIRGIGQNDFAFNMEPGVGLYVDGVYYARTVGAAIDLLDVERVEVLKGPQGTLFGRNTIGGAIHVITRKPAKQYGYKADVTTGSYDRLDMRGTVNLPLVDGLLYSSVSFSSNERDGYQKRIPFDPTAQPVINPVTGDAYTSSFFETDSARFTRARNGVGGDTQGGENNRTGRFKLLFTPSDDFEFLLAADVTYARESATPSSLLAVNGGAFPFTLSYNACIGGVDPSTLAIPAPTFALAGICGLTRGPIGTSLGSVSNRLPYGEHFITGDKDTSYAAGSNFSDVTTWGVSGTADWTLNDALAVKSITAYRKLESAFGVDNGGAPEAMLDTSFTMNQHQISEELQLNVTAFDDRLKSVVGAYYFNEKGDLLDTVTFSAGLPQIYGPNDLENNAWALFTHNNFALTDRLGLTFGLRYTEEEKRFTGGQRDNSGFTQLFVGNFGFPPQVFPGYAEGDLNLLFPKGENKRDFSNTSIRAGLEYELTPDVLSYASYAQGYKSGGFTTRLAAPLAVSNLVSGGVTDPVNPPQHDPEKADTYEVGVKSELFDRRLRLNTAAFWTDYDDIQVVSAPAFTFGAPWFFNAGKARIKGVEMEADARLSNSFVMNAGVGYLDAEYRKLDDVAIQGGLTLDDKLMNVPEWSGNVGGTYTFSLPDTSKLLLHADYIYKDKMARNAENTPLLIQDAFAVVNANLTYAPKAASWQLMLGGENLTNERYIMTGNHNDAVGATTATYNRPRTWFLGLKIEG